MVEGASYFPSYLQQRAFGVAWPSELVESVLPAVAQRSDVGHADAAGFVGMTSTVGDQKDVSAEAAYVEDEALVHAGAGAEDPAVGTESGGAGAVAYVVAAGPASDAGFVVDDAAVACSFEVVTTAVVAVAPDRTYFLKALAGHSRYSSGRYS